MDELQALGFAYKLASHWLSYSYPCMVVAASDGATLVLCEDAGGQREKQEPSRLSALGLLVLLLTARTDSLSIPQLAGHGLKCVAVLGGAENE